MSEPPFELIPSAAPLVPAVLGEQEAVFLLFLEDVVELLCRALVQYHRIFFPVPSEAPRIKVCRAYGAYPSVDHYDFGMVEARLVHPYLASIFHEFMGIVETAVGSQWYVALHAE